MAPINHAIRNDVQYTKAYLEENMSPRILAVTGLFCFMSILIVSMRTYARAFISRCFGWEDTCILVTAVFGLGAWICFVGEAQYVVGRHTAAFTTQEYEMFLIWTFPHFLLATFGIMMAKVSVALLLIRIDSRAAVRKGLYWLMGFVVLYSLVCASALFWSCKPIAANWDMSLPAKRISTSVWLGLFIANSVFNMITDVILAILPISLIWRLRIDKRTKIGLIVVLSLGFIAVVCGGIKTYYQCIYFTQEDKYFEDSFYFWAALELYIGIIAASLPTLKPLVTTIQKKIYSKTGLPSDDLPAPRRSDEEEARQIPCREPIIEWTSLGFTSSDETGEMKEDYRIDSATRSIPHGAMDSVMANDWTINSTTMATTTVLSGTVEEEAPSIVVTVEVRTSEDSEPLSPIEKVPEMSESPLTVPTPRKETFCEMLRRHQWIPHVVAGRKIVETRASSVSSASEHEVVRGTVLYEGESSNSSSNNNNTSEEESTGPMAKEPSETMTEDNIDGDKLKSKDDAR